MPAGLTSTKCKKFKLDLPYDAFTVKVDEKEQQPWNLSPLRTERAALVTADYTIRGLESKVALERKELNDFLRCCGHDRKRFQAMLNRMLAFEHRLVIVECDWATIQRAEWRSQLTAKQVEASVLRWMSDGTPFLFPGSREAAEDAARKWLYLTARKLYRQLRAYGEQVFEALDNAPRKGKGNDDKVPIS